MFLQNARMWSVSNIIFDYCGASVQGVREQVAGEVVGLQGEPHEPAVANTTLQQDKAVENVSIFFYYS